MKIFKQIVQTIKIIEFSEKKNQKPQDFKKVDLALAIKEVKITEIWDNY